MSLKYIGIFLFFFFLLLFFVDQLPNIFAATGRKHNELSTAGEFKSKGPCFFFLFLLDAQSTKTAM